ncbi:MAG: hypothetical protein GEEBNDBF_02021 [bacterium]|nr:hypothetical protein [bacterium]
MIALSLDAICFLVLAQSSQLESAEAQTRIAVLIAAGLSVLIFLMLLFVGRRQLESKDKLNVDWAREEERLRAIAELKKQSRSPAEQAKLAAAASKASASPGTVSSTEAASGSAATVGATAAATEFDDLLPGLSD